MEQPGSEPTNLRQSVLERIDRDRVCPRSRLFFHSRECFVWTLWFITVCVGALAIAVTLFVIGHQRYALYEATHDNYFTFLVTVLPYVWIVTLIFMIVFAVYNIRKTKRGYRYSVTMIAGSSVLVSLAGGAGLQLLGLGAYIDYEFGRLMYTYPSQEKIERALWQAPDDGRLLGRLVGPVGVATATVWFVDEEGTRWRTDISDLFAADHRVLSTRVPVRLMGLRDEASTSSDRFHACAVFPWYYGPDGTRMPDEPETMRQAFLQRIYEHKRTAQGRAEALREVRVAAAEHTGSGVGPCAQLPVVSRVERSMGE